MAQAFGGGTVHGVTVASVVVEVVTGGAGGTVVAVVGEAPAAMEVVGSLVMWHWLVPFCTRMYPASPQCTPQEFLMVQEPSVSLKPVMRTAWSTMPAAVGHDSAVVKLP